MRTNIFRHGKAALASAFAVGLIVASSPVAQSEETTTEEISSVSTSTEQTASAAASAQGDGSQLAAEDVTAGKATSAETSGAASGDKSSPAPESAPAPESSPADAGDRSAAVGPQADFKVKTVKVDGDVATVELSGTITDDSGLNKPLESLMLHNRSTKATVSQVVSVALDDKAGYGEIFSFEPKELKDTFGLSDEDAKFSQILRISLNSEDFGHDQAESLVGKKFSVIYKVPAGDKDAQWALLPNDAAALPDIDFGSQGFAVAGNSPYSRDDGLWVLGSSGGVEKIKYQNGKYVSVESRDIPYYSRKCNTPPPAESGLFDGLAVSPDGNTMYAVHSYSNATRAQEVDDKNGGVSIYKYENGQWNTWNLRNGGRTIAKQPVMANGCAANYNPEVATSDAARGNHNYTFAKARTNFTSGTIIDAGTSNEALIFGGPDSTRFVGSGGQNTLKLFSFQPGTTGAVVKYLGWIPVPHLGPQSVFGGFTSDSDGNVYAAVGDPYAGALNVKIYKFTKDQIRGKINSPAKQFSNNGRYGWGDDSFDKWGFGNDNCGAIGGRTSSKSCAPMLTGSVPGPYTAFNVPLPSGYSLDGFSGFSIAPDGHYTIGTKISRGASHTGTFGYVVEVDDNGRLADGVASYSSLAISGNGQGHHNIEHTDISGALHSSTPQPPNPGPGPTPPPAPNRTFTLFKSLTRFNRLDEFEVGMNNISRNIQGVPYLSTQGKNDGLIKIRETQSIQGSGDLEVVFTEKALGTANLANYDTSVACFADNVPISNLRAYSPVVTGRTWDQRVIIPGSVVGNIECQINNDAQVVPTKNIVLYKRYEKLYEPNDSFNLSMSTKADGIADSNMVIPAPNSQPFHLNFAGRLLNVPVGSQVTVEETAANDSLNNYDKRISCNADNNQFASSQGNVSSLDFEVPASYDDLIVCIVENAAHSKTPTPPPPPATRKVKLFKKFDHLVNSNDVFDLGVRWSYVGKFGEAMENTSGKSEGDYYLITEADVPVGAKFRVFEQAGNNTTELEKYTSKLKCFDTDSNNPPGTPDEPVTSKTFDRLEPNSAPLSCYFDNKLPPPPVKPRTVTLYKKFENTDDTSGFAILGGMGKPLKLFHSGTFDTGDGSYDVGTPFKVGKTISLPEGDQPIDLSENVQQVNSRYQHLLDFNISLECTSADTGITRTIEGVKKNSTWSVNKRTFKEDGTGVPAILPAALTGDINCTLTNSYRKKFKVTLYKDLDKFSERDDFNVKMEFPDEYVPGYDQTYHEDLSKDTSTVAYSDKERVTIGVRNYTRYKLGEVGRLWEDEDQNFRINENASFGSLNNYVTSVECVDDATQTVVARDSSIKDENGQRLVYVNIPANTEGNVSCYLRNDRRPRIFVKHQLDGRYTSTDQFTIKTRGDSFIPPAEITRTTTDQDSTPGTFNVVGDTDPDDHGQPLNFGDHFSIREDFLGGADQANYDTKLVCEDSKNLEHMDQPGREVINTEGTEWSINWTSFRGNVLCTVINTPKANGVVEITKVSAGTNYTLPGSQWKLLKKDEHGQFQPVAGNTLIADNNGVQGADGTDADSNIGVIKIEGLAPGTYKVEEVVAPLGFALPTDEDREGSDFRPGEFEINAPNFKYQVTVQNRAIEVGEMPLTGGVGFAPYVLSGLALVMLAFGSQAYGGRGGRKRMAA